MKLILICLLSVLFSAQSFAYTVYSCSNEKLKVFVYADDYVKGSIGTLEISYVVKPAYNKKEAVLVWKDTKNSVVLKIQPAGSYDGLQDPLWGELAFKSKKIALTCYLKEISRY